MRDCSFEESSDESCSFESAIIRVVPRVERGECLNVGALLLCASRDFVQARIELDAGRLQALAPAIDLDLIEDHLRSIALICNGGDNAGPIGKLAQRARFHWLTAPRSTVIQCSEVHLGLCRNPQTALDQIVEKMVRLPVSNRPPSHEY